MCVFANSSRQSENAKGFINLNRVHLQYAQPPRAPIAHRGSQQKYPDFAFVKRYLN